MRRFLLLALPALTLGGCRDTFAAFGAGARARAAADQLFTALAERHGEQARNAKYEYARLRLTRGALSPSRVFDDTAAWTFMGGATRRLETFGTFVDGHYLLASRPNVPAPAKPADGRHVVSLTHLVDNEYRWDATVDFALGSAPPSEIAALIARLIAGGEGRTDHDVQADVAASAPRTATALGTVFSLDSLRPVSLADGTTSTTVGVSVHSDVLRRRYPSLSEYVHRYLEPSRYRFLLTDRAGVPFLDAAQKDRNLVIRVRTQRGHLVPLVGAPRALPDTLLLQVDLNVKVKIFHVGFHNLVMEFVNGGGDERERVWTMTAKREPQWDLPFITARLVRGPLRRPFAGEGSMFRIGVRAGEGGSPTLLSRQMRLSVQESGILNFINSLGNTAMDEFGGQVEKEENAWLHDLFVALREDARNGIP
ncbi:MAG: hypothetical protein ACJ8AD_09890 [Gemmatimonadaceae bacterium]